MSGDFFHEFNLDQNIDDFKHEGAESHINLNVHGSEQHKRSEYFKDVLPAEDDRNINQESKINQFNAPHQQKDLKNAKEKSENSVLNYTYFNYTNTDDYITWLTADPQLYKNPKAPKMKLNLDFVGINYCHMCRRQTKIAYRCFRGHERTSCNQMFCFDCLFGGFGENILEIIQKTDTWKCPYQRKICQCKICSGSDDIYNPIKNLEQLAEGYDPNMEDDNNASKQTLLEQKATLRLQIKRLVEFNGQLISKMNNLMIQLNDDEIMFYSRLIHSNLTALDNLSEKLTQINKIAEQS